MTPAELSSLRLANQQISVHAFKNPNDVVTWMGAMQAQDYAMARWAVGVRLQGTHHSTIQRCIDKGEIIRTHLLRPTWHLVGNKDASWMLDLAAPQIKTAVRPRLNELEITSTHLKTSLDTFEKVLEGGRSLTRDEMIGELNRNEINTQGQRASYILLWAEVEKVICSGPMVEKKNTYALFAERVKRQKKMTREEGLATLALRYFTSRGPATLQDFINWSALPTADAKKSLESIRRKLIHEKIDTKEYWFIGDGTRSLPDASVYLLPAFDEFIIGYKDRSATVPPKNKSAVVSVNGIFWPVIVTNGMVTGLWKRTVSKKGVKVELSYFPRMKGKIDRKLKGMTAAEVARVRDFFSKDV